MFHIGIDWRQRSSAVSMLDEHGRSIKRFVHRGDPRSLIDRRRTSSGHPRCTPTADSRWSLAVALENAMALPSVLTRVDFFAPPELHGAMAVKTTIHQPGTRVRVIQQMPQRDRAWVNTTEGVITRYEQAKTGSWYAHAKDDQLWLDRLELRLDDGEIVVLNLDQYSVIEAVEPTDDAA